MMTDPGPDIAGARATMDTLTGQLQKLIDEGPRVAREAIRLTASAQSDDKLITATVDARGNLTRLDLDSRIYRRPDSVELAEAIVATVRKAAADVHSQMLDAFDGLGDREQFEVILSGDPDAIAEDIESRTQTWKH